MLVGLPQSDGTLRYCGAVGTGFSQAERRALAILLRRLAADASPFTGAAPDQPGQAVSWVRPILNCEVEYLDRTTARGLLRHPVWKGLRGEQQDGIA